MARIRTIKPDFWEDEKLGAIPIQARLLFIGTWSYADDNGVIRGSAALLKSQIFPYDDNLRIGEVKKWIDALVEARMLIPLSYKGASYYVIRTFRSHQRIDTRYSNELIPREELTALIPHTEYTSSTRRAHTECTAQEMEVEMEIKENPNSDELGQKKDAAVAATNARKEDFRKSLIPYVETYGREMIRAFFDYWTEKNRSGTRMRFELEKTWETARRLATWSNREKEKNCAKREKDDEHLQTDIEAIGRPEKRRSTL